MQKKWLAALGVCLSLIVVPIDFSIVFTAIPTIQNDLKTSLLEMQWMMNIFGICMTALIVTMGRAGDLFGRKKIALIGVALYGLFSLLAGLSPDALFLIISRAFQGVGGAMLLPVSQALIIGVFPKKEQPKALGLWTGIIGIGLAIGPFLGGVLIELFGWRSIFFLNVPITILGYSLMSFTIRESKDMKKPPLLDLPGLILFTIFLGSLITAIVEGPELSWRSPVILVLFLVAATSLVFFISTDKKSPYPIIKFSLYSHPRFLLPSLSNSIAIFICWASMFLIPLYLHQVRNFSPFYVGVTMLAITVPFAIFSPVFGSLVSKVGGKPLITVGLFILAISTLLEIFIKASSPFLHVIVALFLFGIGWSLVMGPSTAAGLASLPQEMAGAASGAWTTVQEIFGNLGLAIVGTIVRGSTFFMQGYAEAFIFMTVLIVCGLVLFLFFFHEKQGSSLVVFERKGF